MSLLDTDTIVAGLTSLEGWSLEGDRIRRDLRFDGFREAIAFINRVAELADAADHHPELTNVYASVTVVLTTHDAGGVTAKDLELATQIDQVVGG